MAVAAHDHEIGAAVGGVRQQRVGDVDIAAGNAVDVDLQSVPGEVLAHIGALDLVLFAAFIGDDDDFDASGLCRGAAWRRRSRAPPAGCRPSTP